MTADRTPQVGDRFFHRGFPYVLTAADAVFASDGRKVGRWHFARATSDDPALEARKKATVGFVKRGLICDASELVWHEPVDLVDAIRSDALQQLRGAPDLTDKLYAQAAADVLAEHLPAVGAWVLPGTLLPERPAIIDTASGDPIPLQLSTPAEAATVAAAVLSCRFHTPAEG